MCFGAPVRSQLNDSIWVYPENSSNGNSGGTVNITTPSGYTCRHTAPRPVEILAGGSYTESQPLAGIGIRIPLGNNFGDCNEFIEIESARLRLQAAIELFEVGLISQEELEAVAANTYEEINAIP